MGNPDKNGSTKIPSCVEAQPTNATVLELMVNPDDADDTKINYILYHYAQAVRKAMENPTKRCQLLNAMLAQEGDGEISLLEFSTENTSFGSGLNADIKQSISENNVYPKGVESGIDAMLLDPNWDANTYLRNKFKYEETEEEPIVHFIKRPVECETTRPVVVVIGTDVNDCDDVAGWRGNTEILMGEGEANATSEIVIFVGVGERGNAGIYSPARKPNIITTEIDMNAVTERNHIDFDVDEHRVKKRFDNSRKSEVMGGWSYYSPSAGGIENVRDAEDFDPRKIHKDDIGSNGTLYTDNKDWMDEIPSIDWSIQFIGYEHDWYASWKHIENDCITDGNSGGNDGDYDLESRRKHSGDMYFNICSITAANMFPNVGSTFTVNNDASMFKFIRSL